MEQFNWAIIGPGNIAKTFADDMKFATTATHRVAAVIHHDILDGNRLSEKNLCALELDGMSPGSRVRMRSKGGTESRFGIEVVLEPEPGRYRRIVARANKA